MATRRQFLLASALGAVAPRLSYAQPRPVRVGMLSARSFSESYYASAIVRRLAELGYREGGGMVLEFRSAHGIADKYPKLARELIDLKCDLIFVVGNEETARPLRDARASVPVVFVAIGYDPVEKGFAASLRRPGGNMTGVYLQSIALATKRLEILREVLPAANRFLVLSDVFMRDELSATRKAAEAARVALTVVEFPKQPYEFAAAFEAGRQAGVEAMIIMASPVFADNLTRLSELLAKHRLPAIGFTGAAEAGFLLSYSSDRIKVAMRAADIGVRILKGAKPADLPVEQIDEFELVVNMKSAKALGVKIPYSVMARATKIIE